MEPDIAPMLRAAGEAARTGRTGEAQAHWERALALAPGHPAALNGLGMLAMAAGRTAEAAERFLGAAEAEPGVTALWLNHAKAARLLGDEEAERASLRRAFAIEPTSLIVNVRLAEQAERIGDAKAARERWNAVVTIAKGLSAIPVEARAAVEHAQRFIAAETAVLDARVQANLAVRRATMAPAERRRVDAAIDHMFGRRSVYLNQCSGLHIPFLPADEFFDAAHFPWFADLNAATAMIRAELIAGGGAGFEPYVALPPGSPRNLWSGLDGSMDWSTLHFWRHGVRDEGVCARFPGTAALLDTLPLARLLGRMPTVFFSVLAPHAHIPPHTGVTNARAIVHLPLIVPEGCRFRVGGDTRPWVEGQAFAFDDTIEHEAWNDSDAQRVVLILDTWNPYLGAGERALLGDFYAASEDALGTTLD